MQNYLAEFERARCFLLPSATTVSGERGGILASLIEAMTVQTPPVSPTTSGIPEIVDYDGNGFLIAPHDPETMAEYVLRLLNDDTEWRKLLRRAREMILDEFDVQTPVDGPLKTFEAGKNTPSPGDEFINSLNQGIHPG